MCKRKGNFDRKTARKTARSNNITAYRTLSSAKCAFCRTRWLGENCLRKKHSNILTLPGDFPWRTRSKNTIFFVRYTSEGRCRMAPATHVRD